MNGPLLRPYRQVTYIHTSTFWYSIFRIKTNFSLAHHHITKCKEIGSTQYYWYYEALQISDSIDDGSGFAWKISLCLMSAWVVVALCMLRGIQTTGKVRNKIQGQVFQMDKVALKTLLPKEDEADKYDAKRIFIWRELIIVQLLVFKDVKDQKWYFAKFNVFEERILQHHFIFTVHLDDNGKKCKVLI